MIVDSGLPEFGYELLSALPYAYHLHEKGELEGTVSGYDTAPLYFFSPNHKEVEGTRGWHNMNALWERKFPNIQIHRRELDWDVWSPPPLKEHYQDKAIKFDKPTVVICNRYNDEYHGKGKPHNFFDEITLGKMFRMLRKDYQVVYVHLNHDDKYDDGVAQKKLNVKPLLELHDVVTVQELMWDYEISWNEAVLRIFAGCERFVTMNGGLCFLAGYFGGENVIYTKDCREVNDKGVNSYHAWYHKLGGSNVKVTRTYEDLLEVIEQKWVKNLPLMNILVRTSNREAGFMRLMESIESQTYKNWKIICSADNKESQEYIADYPVVPVKTKLSTRRVRKPKSEDYTSFFYPNTYFNEMVKLVDRGAINFIDDDDIYKDENSLYKIAEKIKLDSTVVWWRVYYKNSMKSEIVPPNEYWKERPKAGYISGIGFAFSKELWMNWEPFRRGDYRMAKHLYENADVHVWLDELLCEVRPEEEQFDKRKLERKKRQAIKDRRMRQRQREKQARVQLIKDKQQRRRR